MPFIEHQGNRVFFNVHGDGPPVVLGHSFLCSGEMWAGTELNERAAPQLRTFPGCTASV
jgi:pimeloyl-ACP methyl ester carboxylesterase